MLVAVAVGALDGAREIAIAVAAVPLALVLLAAWGLHGHDESNPARSTADDIPALVLSMTLLAWGAACGFALQGAGMVPAVPVLWACAIVALPAMRGAARSWVRRIHGGTQRTVVVGTGVVGQAVARRLRASGAIQLVGFVDEDPAPAVRADDGTRLLGRVDDLPDIVALLRVERVVFAFSLESHARLLEVVRLLRDLDVQVDIVPRLFEAIGPRVELYSIQGMPVIGLPPLRLSPSAFRAKRALDLLIASALLIAVAPVLAVIAAAVKLTSRGPLLYRSTRIGQEGQEIALLKFRTMYAASCRGDGYGGADAEAAFAEILSDPELAAEFERTHKLRRDPRVTRVGRVLRRTSLDELPQLVNVLRGDLSVVGPRPITQDEFRSSGLQLTAAGRPGAVERREGRPPGYWEIGGLRPGLTGYWQINGRSSLSYEERLRLDIAYVTNWSLRLDLLVLARTFRALVTDAA